MILTLLFGCAHRNQTRVFTIDRETYTVCTECGKRIPYSLEHMRPLTRREKREHAA